MKKNKLIGGSLFLFGAIIGASTRTDIYRAFPFWVYILILLIAVAICGTAMSIWNSK
ncbi:MAG: hypothetical protein WCQ16_00880 [Verrucomicrobiae bacterium]